MGSKSELVPKTIADDEICLRCVFHPYHIDSKGKIKREALIPPTGRNDVSLLRESYMPVQDCIEHARKLSNDGKRFMALASLKRKDVMNNNVLSRKEQLDIEADIHYAPMNKGKYIDKSIDVYVNDNKVDLPAHADLKYNVCLDGLVNTNLRKYASKLITTMEIIHNEP